MSNRRAPYAGRKPKRVEYEEPPTLTTAEAPVVPEKENPVEAAPSTGGVWHEPKELPETYAGQEHGQMDWFFSQPKEERKLPVIRGRDTQLDEPREKFETVATVRRLENERPTSIDRWEVATPRPETAVKPREGKSHYMLQPKDKDDAEHKEA